MTGGGSGIGLEIAKQLRLHGVKGVLLMGRREDVLRNSVDSLSNGRGDPGDYAGGCMRNVFIYPCGCVVSGGAALMSAFSMLLVYLMVVWYFCFLY